MQHLRRPIYFMVKPPAGIAEHIAMLRRASWQRGAHLLHITLLPIGDLPEPPSELLDRLKEIAIGIEAAPFRVVFDRIVETAKSVALRGSEPIRGANAFQKTLVETLTRRGLALQPRYRFVPHITINYRPDDLGSEPVDPISWLVEDFRLIESVVGEGRHIEHGRWTLQANT